MFHQCGVNMRHFLKNGSRILATALAVIFLTENSVLLNAAEANMWDQRRKAVQTAQDNADRMEKTVERTQAQAQTPRQMLAMLPMGAPAVVTPFSPKALADLGVTSSMGNEAKISHITRYIPAWIPTAVAPFA